MLGKCLRRLVQKPLVLGSFALMYGYVSGYLKGIPQVDDPVAIAYLRQAATQPARWPSEYLGLDPHPKWTALIKIDNF